MRKSLIFLLALCWSLHLAPAQEALPTIRILPEDIVPDSIEQLPFGSNAFTVRWTYTEAGAKKMLAFQRKHAGHKTIIQVGDFETRCAIAPFESRPPDWTEEGWLKRRTDKFFSVSGEDAKKIVAGLKSQ